MTDICGCIKINVTFKIEKEILRNKFKYNDTTLSDELYSFQVLCGYNGRL